ncbi:MAG: glycoside hydrolase family 130 protein [Ginsengibacter sp.]
MKITKKDIRFYASPKAVITQFLHLPGNDRVKNIVERVESLQDKDVLASLDKIKKDFADRHHNLDEILLSHFKNVESQFKEKDLSVLSSQKKLLIGAYFTKEYSIESAALFNPSIVPHPDQSGLQKGEQRFIMSLRATGEGHISSVVFKTGIINLQNDIIIDESSRYFTALKNNERSIYEKSFVAKRAVFFKGFRNELLDILPQKFTTSEALQIIHESEISNDISFDNSIQFFKNMMDSNYELESSSNIPLNEKVIFPSAQSESMGMEDVRWVKFIDGNEIVYYGTYTAYNGHRIQTQMIETADFDVFKIRTLYGDAIADKGMALFPEKVNGKYVMISRQGGEKISIMYSDDLYVWNSFQTLMEPLYPWELMQLGNCGSPIKTEKGWLLLTHGVGIMRTYVISAVLLDLQNPSVILGRLDKPILEADENEREGYVPNVVYTCGLLRHGDVLIIPYAVSDSATGFVTIELNEILNELI